MKKSFAIIDPRYYNGAMFVGIDGIVVKSHGSSDDVAFANSVQVVAKLVREGINKDINEMIEHHHVNVGTSLVSKIKHTFGLE